VQVATRLAEEAQINNVEFRAASVYQPGLSPASIDYSYSRWLLVHLSAPVEAMKVIYRALKPGGTMVCEEADVSAVYAEPKCAAYEEIRDLGLASGVRRGVDYTGGRRVHTWAKQAGFEVIHAGAYHPHYVTGPHKGFWSWTLLEGGASLVKEGVLTEARLDELAKRMRATDDNPEVLVAHCRMHQLIARKPH
jgi:SAM-dependent methyltransferase